MIWGLNNEDLGGKFKKLGKLGCDKTHLLERLNKCQILELTCYASILMGTMHKVGRNSNKRFWANFNRYYSEGLYNSY